VTDTVALFGFTFRELNRLDVCMGRGTEECGVEEEKVASRSSVLDPRVGHACISPTQLGDLWRTRLATSSNSPTRSCAQMRDDGADTAVCAHTAVCADTAASDDETPVMFIRLIIRTF
jgi:hypothetical protein